MTIDRWSAGDAYEAYIGRWSRPVGVRFLGWLGVPTGARWADVGCGTGALSDAILAHCRPASVHGTDPSQAFIESVRDRISDPRTQFAVATAASLPLEDDAVDAVVAGLVLDLVPEVRLALQEMVRVGAPGATVGAYVWDYAGRMEPIRRFWDAAVALDPGASALDEGVRSPICAPDPLRTAFEAAGLDDIEGCAIEVDTVFRHFDDYWTPFLTAVGPAPGYTASLTEPARAELRERLRSTLPTDPDGRIPLVARAWAIRGRCP